MTGEGTGIRWTFPRVLALALLPFLAVASVLLVVLPGSTDATFAWTIRPDLSAMLLGSAYLGGIWFFVQVLRLPWAQVRRGMPAVLAFATLLLVATLLHWDRFAHGHVSFVTWIVLYATTPFLVLAAIVRGRRDDDGRPATPDREISRPLRLVLAALGVGAIAVGALLFVVPQAAIDVWAWELTPLTARVLGAMMLLPGVVDVQLLVDRRWSAFAAIMQAQLFSLGFLLASIAIARADLDWSRPLTPVVVGGLAVFALVYAGMLLGARRFRPLPAG